MRTLKYHLFKSVKLMRFMQEWNLDSLDLDTKVATGINTNGGLTLTASQVPSKAALSFPLSSAEQRGEILQKVCGSR